MYIKQVHGWGTAKCSGIDLCGSLHNIFNTVAYLLKARIVKSAETAVTRQWLSSCHVKAATDIHATTEEQLL
jgi:hypothetical protein